LPPSSAAGRAGVRIRAPVPPAIPRRNPADFDRHGAWRNASLAECLPSRGADELIDVTEDAATGDFFSTTARSRLRRRPSDVRRDLRRLRRRTLAVTGAALLQFVLQSGCRAGRTCPQRLEDDRATPDHWTLISRFRGPSNSAKMTDWNRRG